MDPEMIYNISLLPLFIGLLLLLAGFLLRKRKESHLILVFSWIIFGVFWLLQVPHFLDIDDTFNAIFCFLGFVLFLFFSYHEALNLKWNEYLYNLNYIAGIVAVAGIFYYTIEKVEPLAKGLIYVVAWKSVALLNLFGYNYALGSLSQDIVTHELRLQIIGTDIAIVLACTGIQSIAIFVGILVATKSNRKLWVPWTKRFLKKEMPENVKNSRLRSWLWEYKKRRMRKVLNMTDSGRLIRAFMYTVPVIYVLNIFRNVLIIYGTVNEVLGPNTFYIAHHQLSKVFSLAVLIIMVFIVFELLPECQEGIIGLLDLPKRTSRGMVKDGFIKLKDTEGQEPDTKKKDKTRIKNKEKESFK